MKDLIEQNKILENIINEAKQKLEENNLKLKISLDKSKLLDYIVEEFKNQEIIFLLKDMGKIEIGFRTRKTLVSDLRFTKESELYNKTLLEYIPNYDLDPYVYMDLDPYVDIDYNWQRAGYIHLIFSSVKEAITFIKRYDIKLSNKFDEIIADKERILREEIEALDIFLKLKEYRQINTTNQLQNKEEK